MCICTVHGPVGLRVAGNSEETGTLPSASAAPLPPPLGIWAHSEGESLFAEKRKDSSPGLFTL